MKSDLRNSSFDLEERTTKLGEKVIDLCKIIEKNDLTLPIIKQLIRSATSVGANYMEANGASSRKDFRNKIYICKKEIKETKHWLRMLVRILPEKEDQIRIIWREAEELTKIFGKITSTLDNKNK
ncbi:four helix bundle protein [bacterium]|nr:four helix bundle protein [bacterium]